MTTGKMAASGQWRAGKALSRLPVAFRGMRAAQLLGPGEISIVDLATPTPGPGQALVRVLACGICGSDMNAWKGVPGVEFPLPPGAPGHEVWGEVAAVGADVANPGLADGARVTGLMQNGYAEYAVAAADELIVVPPDLAQAPLLGEPLACAANVVRRAAVPAGAPVAFVGFGYLAALVAQLLSADGGHRWVAISRRPESLGLAKALGAEAAHPYDAVPPDLWDSFPVVIEAAGVQQSLDYATWLTAYGGRLVIAGYHADGPRTVNMQTWNWKGIDVINAHERQSSAYLAGLRAGLETVQKHRLDLGRLISHRWPLARLADAMSTAEARPADYVKGIVEPWSG